MGTRETIKRNNRRMGTPYQMIVHPELLEEGFELSPIIEYGYFALNTQATKPFVAAYVVKAFLDYDSTIKAGDLVQLYDGRKLLITVKNPEIYGKKIVRYMSICYKCNMQAKIERKSGTTTDPVTMRNINSYETIVPQGTNCLITEGDFRSELIEDKFGRVEIGKKELYLQGKYDIELGDRVMIDGDPKPMYIRQIKRNYFVGIDFCIMDYEN